MFHMYLKRIGFLLLGGMFYICLLGSFILNCSSVPFFSSFIICLNVLSIAENGYSPTTFSLMYIFLHICYLLNVFRCSEVECIYIDNYCIFLMNWLLYHYIMTLFLVADFDLKSVLSHTSKAIPPLFCFFNCMEYLFLSSYFQPVSVNKENLSESLIGSIKLRLFLFLKNFI